MTTTDMLPLLSHRDATQTVAYRLGRPVSGAEFLADARALVRALPPAHHVLNACSDRYRFAVALAAAMLSQRVSLLPPTHTPEMVRQLQIFAPDTVCLVDGSSAIALPQFDCRNVPATAQADWGDTDIPCIPAAQLVAHVFTSGSTGLPLPHPKTWGALVRNVAAEAQRLGLADGRSHAILGTVPPQHMYGFESTLLVAWQSGAAFSAAHPFYPADIASALADLPAPRLLVSTPVHLRALLGAAVPLPAVDRVLCATAPLAQELAQELEHRLAAPLLEIYGATESGQIASRRTAHSAHWELFPDLVLCTDSAGRTWVSGGHVESPVALGDVIELHGARHFNLLGRTADMVNIAGKRNSLAYLNHQLLSIAGVEDGVFLMPDERPDGVTRLQAFVVAPGLSATVLQQALRHRIDPVFMPRPLLMLDALPRNSTGKLTRDALQALAAGASRAQAPRLNEFPWAATWRVPADHPAFAGHFPGAPILPGVLVLDAVLHLAIRHGEAGQRWRVAATKFLSPVQPGDTLHMALERAGVGDGLRFDVRNGERRIATGQLLPHA